MTAPAKSPGEEARNTLSRRSLISAENGVETTFMSIAEYM